MDLGERIREARLQRGLSLGDLAAVAHLSKGFLSQVESGRANPSLASLRSIAASLDVPVHRLVAPEASFPAERPAELRLMRGGAWGGGIVLLHRTSNMTVHAITIPPGLFLIADAQSCASGEAFGYLTTGTVAVNCGGDRASITSGDSLTWPLSDACELDNHGSSPARLLLTIPAGVEMASLRLQAPPPGAPSLMSLAIPPPVGPLRLVALRAQRSAAGRKR